MTLLAVDLAAKFSAACLMDEQYQVLYQYDSWGISEDDFIELLSDPWMLATHPPDVMVVEDLPHGLSYSKLVKTVCRLQGRIGHAMYEATDGNAEDVLFVAPAAWRSHYTGMQRGTGPTVVTSVAARYGYQAPDEELLRRAKGNGGPSRARKVATDYCSAYLIARWAIDMKTEHGTYDVPGTSRYGHPEILKKEFHAQNS